MTYLEQNDAFLFEISWEVCNQEGGIYTVIRSKLDAVNNMAGENYCLVGPLENPKIDAEFEHLTETSSLVGKTVSQMRNMGYEVLYGRWLVTGKPKTVLINYKHSFNRLENIKKELAEGYNVHTEGSQKLVDTVLMFGDVVKTFLKLAANNKKQANKEIIAHFHEWMGVTALLHAKLDKTSIKSVFTTHATLLGRYLASNEDNYYEKLEKFDWKLEARRFNIMAEASIEYWGAKLADAFTTVSAITAIECETLLGVKPHVTTPNGLNIERFAAHHELQNKHIEVKNKLHRFTIGHFFQSYTFNLDNTIYIFSSGRYEFKNKGYDVSLAALKRLNEMMVKEKVDKTVVYFLITKRPSWSINPNVLESRGVMEELSRDCDAISKQIKERLFFATASDENAKELPVLNSLVDEYWELRFRRTLQSWKDNDWPIIVTHNLKDDVNDDVLNYMRSNNLLNSPLDKVKFVYHPDFLSSTSPLLGLDYDDFVRGCHLGLFPSYYEPWGYTPLECIARGVATITSDLSGFGNYVSEHHEEHEDLGISVLKSTGKSFDDVVEELAIRLLNFVKTSSRSRIDQRNKLENFSENFDWHTLIKYYQKAYDIALKA